MNLKKVTYNQKKGMLLEKAVDIALNILSIEHKTNPFDESYAQEEGQGIDGKINTDKGLLGYECKNVNGKHELSTNWIDEEINNRDKDTFYILRILVISLLNVGKELMRKLEVNLRVIILGFQITSSKLFKKAVDILVHKLYWIKMRYFNDKSKSSSSNSNLPMYNSIIESDVINTNIFNDSSLLLRSIVSSKLVTNLDSEIKIGPKIGPSFNLAGWVLSLVSPRL